ncbi:hypothetical protein [Haladaptatus sp. W1]|uniref:hypothetical protein n=1 Tax=Haladaptatus sp. W1 TaxID=1897478 RepID=UPI001112F510|nr:hypothetical protein [Haladaptatus sp. W1]
MSIVWFIASLPIITLGPATLGAYSVVRSLRETGSVDRARTIAVIRTNGIHAILLALVPLVFVATAALYLRTGTPLGSLSMVVAAACMYVGGYLGIALIPAFIAMAEGESPVPATKRGYVWVASQPVSTVSLAIVTAILFVATAVLTIGFVLLFPALAFSYHAEVLTDDLVEATSTETSIYRAEGTI